MSETETKSMRAEDFLVDKKIIPKSYAGGGSISYETNVRHEYDNRFDLITKEALEGVAQAMAHGSEKYSDRDWEDGLSYSYMYRKALGHMLDWYHGENEEDESGLNPLDLAAARIMMLQTYVKRGMVKYDDRPKSEDYDAMSRL